MVPDLQVVFPGELIPDAPEDMYSALGLNDQKIYVVPSQDVVVVRQGNAAGEPLAGPSSFDNQLWVKINELICDPTGITEPQKEVIRLFPNPAKNEIRIVTPYRISLLKVINTNGQEIYQEQNVQSLSLDISGLGEGMYFLEAHTEGRIIRKPFVKN